MHKKIASKTKFMFQFGECLYVIKLASCVFIVSFLITFLE